MKFYPKKFILLRKKERFTIKEICTRAKISRGTLWGWESAKRIPSEQNIRMLAKIINQPVESISNLISETNNSSNGKLDEVVDSWLALSDSRTKKLYREYSWLSDGIKKLSTELSQASIISNALQSSLGVIFYLKDLNLDYLTASDSFLENLGLNPDYNVKGKNDYDFYPKRCAERNTNADLEVLSTGKEIIHREEIIPGSRNKRWGLVSRRTIRDSFGKVAGIISMFVDITERKRNEEVQRLLKNTLDSAHHGIILLNAVGDKIYYYNHSTLKSIFGYSKYEVYFINNKIYDFWLTMCVHPDDREQEEKYFKEGIWPKTRIYRIVKPTGEIRVLETSTSKYLYNDEECNLNIIADITDRKYTWNQ